MTQTPLWQVHVLTLFPEMFPGPLGFSLPGKALESGIWKLHAHQLRDFAFDKHHKVDDTPYGGGSGMVMLAEVIDAALNAPPKTARKIYLSPRGRRLDQALLKELSATPEIALLCGRYEGLDQRVIEAQGLEEISLGDFVLAGGEIPALALIEGAVRLLPGVLGNEAALGEESFAAGLLEYPQYTRPALWRGRAVPEVLLQGDHAKVKEWRLKQAEALTKEKRQDLWEVYRKPKNS
ncbi:MAG: tRNA (guanosine(37)-N1)-methyltransferase TrmD [Proteobacteria bacterium]|nr:tRNA (guanosine(37)-N1)-methyltransferase TrmD [Pseudomonadota bacterium]